MVVQHDYNRKLDPFLVKNPHLRLRKKDPGTFEDNEFNWMVNKDAQLITKSEFHDENECTGQCSTPAILLICSSFSREDGHLLLICSSLSTSQCNMINQISNPTFSKGLLRLFMWVILLQAGWHLSNMGFSQ